MTISVLDVVGPVMIGPSSSHTAGAARLSRVARLLVAKPFSRVCFGLHGSFAQTYKGHGTDRALVAGALGLREDDERMVDAFSLAEQAGLIYEFYPAELDGVHENSVKMSFYCDDGKLCEVVGSSIGGGQIVIRRFNEFIIEFAAQSSAIFIIQRDQKGLVSRISGVLAESDINIGVMKLSRTAKGDKAFCVIETDSAIPDEILQRISAVPGVLSTRAFNLESGEEQAHV